MAPGAAWPGVTWCSGGSCWPGPGAGRWPEGGSGLLAPSGCGLTPSWSWLTSFWSRAFRKSLSLGLLLVSAAAACGVGAAGSNPAVGGWAEAGAAPGALYPPDR